MFGVLWLFAWVAICSVELVGFLSLRNLMRYPLSIRVDDFLSAIWSCASSLMWVDKACRSHYKCGDTGRVIRISNTV